MSQASSFSKQGAPLPDARERVQLPNRLLAPEFSGESATPEGSNYRATSGPRAGPELGAAAGGGGAGPAPGPFGTPVALSNAAQRLGKVAEKFSTFYTDLEHERQHRRDAESTRFTALVDTIHRLEQSLALEVQRREESDRALQVQLSGDLKSFYDRMHAQGQEAQRSLKTSVDALSRSFAELHNKIKDEKEERAHQMEQLEQRLMLKIDASKAGLDDEKVSRLEREAQTLKRVGEDVFRLQERIEQEKSQREAALHSMQSELNEVAGGRNLSDEKFQALILGEIAALKSKLQVERDERVCEDEQIVLAINDYTKALQDGLRIVSAG